MLTRIQNSAYALACSLLTLSALTVFAQPLPASTLTLVCPKPAATSALSVPQHAVRMPFYSFAARVRG